MTVQRIETAKGVRYCSVNGYVYKYVPREGYIKLSADEMKRLAKSSLVVEELSFNRKGKNYNATFDGNAGVKSDDD